MTQTNVKTITRLIFALVLFVMLANSFYLLFFALELKNVKAKQQGTGTLVQEPFIGRFAKRKNLNSMSF